MPYVQLPRRPDTYINPLRLWYKIQGVDGTPNLDQSKHTLLIIHSIFGDAENLGMFFNDTRLRRRVNMIAFDQRSHGKTESTVSPKSDMAVMAADIVLALRELGIHQKLHCVSTATSAPVIASNLAALFPDRFLSFTIYGMPLIESEKNSQVFAELADFILRPRDPQEFLQGVDGSFEFQFGSPYSPHRFITEEVQTLISKTALGRYSPAAARRQWEARNHGIIRPLINKEFFHDVKCPVLIYHGNYDLAYSVEEAEEFASYFKNAKVQIEHLDGPHCCYFTNGTELSTLILQFLSKNFIMPQSPSPSPGILRNNHFNYSIISTGGGNASSSSLAPPSLSSNYPPSQPLSSDEIVRALKRSAIIRGDDDEPDLNSNPTTTTTTMGDSNSNSNGVSWKEPINSEDFCCLNKETVIANEMELGNLLEVERHHRDWLPIGNYWENGQQDQDFDFKFQSRHDYFDAHKGGRYSLNPERRH